MSLYSPDDFNEHEQAQIFRLLHKVLIQVKEQKGHRTEKIFADKFMDILGQCMVRVAEDETLEI